ncbi:MAG: PorP/SprF family type IX secretion system membrane protein [Bacteroidaceae bacterium]|nr:PorP/SprF family type IX secretion system membrane protein [Bacteroidaceae bacterium]
MRTLLKLYLLRNRLHLLLVVALSFFSAEELMAQHDPAFVQYWKLETQFNPAAVGKYDEVNLKIGFQTHATGFEDAGSTLFANGDIAFAFGNTRHGVGLMLQNDEIGLFSHKRFSLQYAYYFNLWGGKLASGLGVDLLSEGVDGGKAEVNDSSDPVFSGSDMNGSGFDLSLGVYYTHTKWYAAFALQHLTAPTVSLGETSELKINSLYNFTAGYNISTLYPFLTLSPSVMLRYDGTNFRSDLTARATFNKDGKHMYGGLNYAPQHSVALFFGFLFHGLDIGYSYEANTSGMGMSSANHELTLGYKFDLDLGKKGKNLHKSVRWL